MNNDHMTTQIKTILMIILFFILGIMMWKYSTTDKPQPKTNAISWQYLEYSPTVLDGLSGNIVLFFHADRCPTCQQAEKNFLQEGISEWLTIIKVNFDKETELKKKYSILTQTSFVLVQPDGTLIKRWVGGTRIDDILSKIEETTTQDTRTPSDQIAKAYFAGWCFRCMEWPFEAINGVKTVVSGYIGWSKQTATYEQVSAGKTDHKEAVEVTYDPALVTYEELLQTYRRQIDPTDAGGQFADRWSQYHTAIYYSTDEEMKQATASKKSLGESGKFDKPIAVEIVPSVTFYPAEDYHQDYYKTNAAHYASYAKWSGRKDYIASNWKNEPTTNSRKNKKPKSIDELSDTQRNILFEWWTEPAFNNAYRNNHEQWIYVDVIDGTPLFSSTDKFDSGTGRPSFTRPIEESFVWAQSDTSYGIQRTEIKSTTSNGHLGHIFDDGPKESWGTRYCINSAALEFVPLAELDAKGYSDYKKLFTK